MTTKILPSVSYLKSIIDYDPIKGTVTRKSTGKLVGNVTSQKYPEIRIDGVTYLLHIICFFIYYGYIPEEVDHKDGDRYNLKIDNLRASTRSQNGCNRSKQSNNTSGYKGIDLHGSTWRYRIYLKGKVYSKSGFSTAEEAFEASKKVRSSIHGEFAKY